MENASEYNFLSDLEKKVYSWLTKRKVLFNTQQKMFGQARELGSATVDFIISNRRLALRVMGEYYHSSLESKARDAFGKEQLINAGYEVVDLWEEDLSDEKLNHTLELALLGQEIPR